MTLTIKAVSITQQNDTNTQQRHGNNNGATTLSIKTHSIMTVNITTLSIPLSMMTIIITLSIMTLTITHQA